MAQGEDKKIHDWLPERFLLVLDDDRIREDETVETHLARLVNERKAVIIDNRKNHEATQYS